MIFKSRCDGAGRPVVARALFIPAHSEAVN
jgi:hypothetical protein